MLSQNLLTYVDIVISSDIMLCKNCMLHKFLLNYELIKFIMQLCFNFQGLLLKFSTNVRVSVSKPSMVCLYIALHNITILIIVIYILLQCTYNVVW